MKTSFHPTAFNTGLLGKIALGGCLALSAQTTMAAGDGWSIVPYFGFSQLGDQSPDISADGIADGNATVSVDGGFTAGLSIRYDYTDSRWRSEFGWEYRSNNSTITSADETTLADGNYASNTFYLNGRYALTDRGRFTPWIGGGISVIQEIDIDSEQPEGERSFSDSGAVGLQLMAGFDFDITDRIYLTSELRYTGFTDLDLTEEQGNGQATGLDYQPVTAGVGIGFRF